jgi:hypothetical protein
MPAIVVGSEQIQSLSVVEESIASLRSNRVGRFKFGAGSELAGNVRRCGIGG